MHPERQLEIHEGHEPFRAPRDKTRRDRRGLSNPAVLSLFCQLLIFWLLLCLYVYVYNPYIILALLCLITLITIQIPLTIRS
jgi:hypothetical protein